MRGNTVPPPDGAAATVFGGLGIEVGTAPSVKTETDAEAVLAALELPAEGVVMMLDHVESFCEQHGGGARYADLPALVRRHRPAAPAP